MFVGKKLCPIIKNVASTPLDGRGQIPYQQSAGSSVFTFDVVTPTDATSCANRHARNNDAKFVIWIDIAQSRMQPLLQLYKTPPLVRTGSFQGKLEGWKGARIIISFLWLFASRYTLTAFAYLHRLPFDLRLFKFTIGVPARWKT